MFDVDLHTFELDRWEVEAVPAVVRLRLVEGGANATKFADNKHRRAGVMKRGKISCGPFIVRDRDRPFDEKESANGHSGKTDIPDAGHVDASREQVLRRRDEVRSLAPGKSGMTLTIH